ncbi:unnamed protein product, partial [Allacma fusca]
MREKAFSEMCVRGLDKNGLQQINAASWLCIVGQLYHNLVGKDKTNLINASYAHSVTVMDTNTGKKKSKKMSSRTSMKSIRDKGGKTIGKATEDAPLIEDDFTAFEHNANETE